MNGFFALLMLALAASCVVTALPSRQLRIRQIYVPAAGSESKHNHEHDHDHAHDHSHVDEKKSDSIDSDSSSGSEHRGDADEDEVKPEAKPEKDDMEREVQEYLRKYDHEDQHSKGSENRSSADDAEREQDDDELKKDDGKSQIDDEESKKKEPEVESKELEVRDEELSEFKPIVVADEEEHHEHHEHHEQGRAASLEEEKADPKSAEEVVGDVADADDALKAADSAADDQPEPELKSVCQDEQLQRRIDAVIAELHEIKSLCCKSDGKSDAVVEEVK